jgi:hypothetical protein
MSCFEPPLPIHRLRGPFPCLGRELQQLSCIFQSAIDVWPMLPLAPMRPSRSGELVMEQGMQCKDEQGSLLEAKMMDRGQFSPYQSRGSGLAIHTSGRNPCSRIASLVACTDLVLLRE